MTKKPINTDAESFGRRLQELMRERFPERRGAGAWLARRYRVSTVTANSWLKGEHKPEPGLARRIADDNGSTFDYLYFGKVPADAVSDERADYGDTNTLADNLHHITLALTALCDWIRETRPIEAPLLAENLERMARLDGSLSAKSPIGVMLLALDGAKPTAGGKTSSESKPRTTTRSHHP